MMALASLAQRELLRIQPLNLPQQHVTQCDALFLPLDSKNDSDPLT